MYEQAGDVSNAFYEALRIRLKAAGTNLSQLSIELGFKRGWLSGLKTRKSLPDVYQAKRIADHLGCKIEELLGPKEPFLSRDRDAIISDRVSEIRATRGFDRPPIMTIVRWHLAEHGRITKDNAHMEYFELFRRPRHGATHPDPVFIRARSLGATEMRVRNVEEMKTIFFMSNTKLRNDVIEAHRRVIDMRTPELTHHVMTFDLGKGIKLELHYNRFLAPVTDESGEVFVLNYSFPTTRNEIVSDAVTRDNKIPASEVLLSG